jgi:hypothetical protein
LRESDLPPARHEPTDISVRLLWIGVPAVLCVVLLLCWVVLMLYPGSMADQTLNLPLPHFPAPELQPDPVSDMDRLRAAQLRQLTSTGPVGEQRKLQHIPIDDAMHQIAADGIADWPTDARREPHAQ